MAPLNKQEASAEMIRAELANRKLSWRHLSYFTAYVYPWWEMALCHALICDALEKVYSFIETSGETGTGALIIEMPPQHGKTTIVSRSFPAWVLGRRPDTNVIVTGYSDDLAGDNSREVRLIVTGEYFTNIFGERSAVDDPVAISKDSTSRAAWHLAEPHRGSVRAAGVGGGTTGRQADLIIVDDPFKNREEAENPQIRKKVLKWYTASVLSRRRKGTAVVIIHTRWHRQDLIGEALKAMATDPKALKFEVLSLPAYPLEKIEYAKDLVDQRKSMLAGLFRPLADPIGREPGSQIPLWEREFPPEMLEQIKATLAASGQLSDWHSLYQQQPRPAEGIFFKETDFRTIPKAPEGLNWVRCTDLAISERNTADFNASLATAMDGEGNVFYRDMLRQRGWAEFAPQLKFAMKSTEEVGTQWGIEDVAFQALALQDLLKEPDLANIAIYPYTPKGDKVTRARAVQSRGRAGKVFLVDGPWVPAFIEECLDFPTGTHDDQVDTASGGLQMIAEGILEGSLMA